MRDGFGGRLSLVVHCKPIVKEAENGSGTAHFFRQISCGSEGVLAEGALLAGSGVSSTVVEEFATLARLESRAAGLACKKAGKRDMARIAARLDDLELYLGLFDRARYQSAHSALLAAIVSASHNAGLIAEWRALVSNVEGARIGWKVDRRRWSRDVSQLHMLLQALRDHDAGRAATLIHEHRMNSLTYLPAAGPTLRLAVGQLHAVG